MGRVGEFTTLGKVSKSITSGSRGWARYYAEDGALFLRMTNLPREGVRMRMGDLAFVRLPSGLAEAERTRVQRGDVLISITAELGKIGLVDNGPMDAFVNQHIACVRPDPSRVDSTYLAYYLASPDARKRFQRLNDAGAKAGLNLKAVGSFRIALLPLDEQRRIADILATWDAAIEKAERLITLKRVKILGIVKAAAISREGARTVRIGDICEISKGSGLPKKDLSPTGSRPCILYGELHTTYREVASQVLSRTDVTKAVQSKTGDVLIPSSSETREDLANATALPQDGVLLGGDINILRPKVQGEYDAEYLAYHLTHAKRKEIASLAQGNSVVHLYGRDIARIEVALPDVSTQSHIARALRMRQHEVELLVRLGALYRRQKAGLMQILLGASDRNTP